MIAENCQRSPVRIVSGRDRFSGVLITAAGHVLTVAHGLAHPDRPVDVLTADGQRLSATVLVRDTRRDVALLQLQSAGQQLPPPLAVSEVLPGMLQDPVLACGYPGRESDQQPAILRIGQILSVTDQSLRSSCTLTVGDSGGPLVDSGGRLLGLHRRIGVLSDQNLHIPLAVCLDAVEAQLPEDSLRPPNLRHSDQIGFKAADLGKSPDAKAGLLQHGLELQFTNDQTADAASRSIAGTLITADRCVTKASLSGDAKTALATLRGASNGRPQTVKATLLGIDRATDLAVWQLEVSLPLSNQQQAAAAEIQFGTLVFSLAPDTAGIISRLSHSEPGLPLQLGCELSDSESGQLIVRSVLPRSAAFDAGLRAEDVLLSVDQIATNSFEQLAGQLVRLQPGDWIRLQYRRGDTVQAKTGQLRHDPSVRFAREEFLDGRAGQLSDRRSGFAGVLQHDLNVLPRDCGGPLVDQQGRLIAVNIARRGRAATLAVPLATVRHLVQAY